MNADQKRRAKGALTNWLVDEMAALLQELIDAPEAEPVAWLHIPHDHLKDRIQSLASTVKYSDPAVYAEILPCYVIPTAPPAPSVRDAAPEDIWRAMCGDWRDKTVAIHNSAGYITCGLDPAKAAVLVRAHNGEMSDGAAAIKEVKGQS